MTPTAAVNAVPNPAQIAYALESGNPLRERPKNINEDKNPIITPKEGNKTVNPEDNFNMVVPNTSQQMAKAKNIKYLMTLASFYYIRFNNTIPIINMPIPNAPFLLIFSLKKNTPAKAVNTVPLPLQIA